VPLLQPPAATGTVITSGDAGVVPAGEAGTLTTCTVGDVDAAGEAGTLTTSTVGESDAAGEAGTLTTCTVGEADAAGEAGTLTTSTVGEAGEVGEDCTATTCSLVGEAGADVTTSVTVLPVAAGEACAGVMPSFDRASDSSCSKYWAMESRGRASFAMVSGSNTYRISVVLFPKLLLISHCCKTHPWCQNYCSLFVRAKL
jgi:hypothetical protein